MKKIDLLGKINIPLGLLSFILLHELVFTGAVALAAPLISSVVITKTKKYCQIEPNALVQITACIACYSTCWWTCRFAMLD